MKRLLKYLRSLVPLNVVVRHTLRALTLAGTTLSRFASKHLPVYGTISFRLPGGEPVRIYSRGDDFVSTQAFWRGFDGYEGPTVRLFYHLCKHSQTIVDIGANVGYFTLIAAAANPKASVLAFEPVPSIHARLCRNIQLNSFSNVEAVQAAVGDRDATIKLFVPRIEGMPHAASSRKGWVSNVQEMEVDCVRIDTYCSKNAVQRIDLLKMDCEFYEPEALSGMGGMLERSRPLIFVEVLFPEQPGVKDHYETRRHLEIEQIMRDKGYAFYLLNETAVIRVDRLEYNPDDRNYLFSPKRSKRTYMPVSDMRTLISEVL